MLSYPERKRREFVTKALFYPWMIVGPMLALILVNAWLDRQSDRYIAAPAFHALADCPARLPDPAPQWLDRDCVDPRYRIHQTPERYYLPRVRTKYYKGWLRIGPDAALLRGCYSEGCEVVRVLRNHFPIR